MVVGMDLLNEVTEREGEPVLFTQKGASTCPCPCVAWPCGL